MLPNTISVQPKDKCDVSASQLLVSREDSEMDPFPHTVTQSTLLVLHYKYTESIILLVLTVSFYNLIALQNSN